jgi:hypothetical protein
MSALSIWNSFENSDSDDEYSSGIERDSIPYDQINSGGNSNSSSSSSSSSIINNNKKRKNTLYGNRVEGGNVDEYINKKITKYKKNQRLSSSSSSRIVSNNPLVLRNKLIESEHGDVFRITPKNKSSGIKQGQRLLFVHKRDDGDDDSTDVTNPFMSSPLLREGYINKEQQLRGMEPPYNVEFVREYITRERIIQNFPDYQFLTLFATELNLNVEDLFVSESISRAQAASVALIETVESRKRARLLSKSNLASSIQKKEIIIESLKSIQEESETNTTENDISSFAEKSMEEYKYFESIGHFIGFLFILYFYTKETSDEEGANSTGDGLTIYADPNSRKGDYTYFDMEEQLYLNTIEEINDGLNEIRKTTGEYTEDDEVFIKRYEGSFQISPVVFYIFGISKSSNTPFVRSIRNLFESYKDTNPGEVNNLLYMYARLDFIVSFFLTYPSLMTEKEESGVSTITTTTTTTINIYPLTLNPSLRNRWKIFDPNKSKKNLYEDIKNVLTYLYKIISSGGGRGDHEDMAVETLNKIDYMKRNLSKMFQKEDVLSTILNDIEQISMDLTKIFKNPTVRNHLETLYNNSVFIYKDNKEEIMKPIKEAVEIFSRGKEEEEEEEEEGGGRSSSRYNKGIITFGINMDFSKEVEDNIEYWIKKILEWAERREGYLTQIKKRISITEREKESLEEELESMERTEDLSDESIISDVRRIPTTDVGDPAWAFNPINTGMLRIQSWVTGAIDQGHAFFKQYMKRIRKDRWDTIDREIIQRDTLMGPLFASLCATFTQRAKIGNPRRYMRNNMEKERRMFKASVVKQMISLRYHRAKRQFY